MAQVGIQEPRLVQDGAVELGTNKLGLVETCSAQPDAREVKAGQVESGQPFAGEIGLVRSQRGLDIRACHLGRNHVGRREIEMTHRILRARHQRQRRPATESRDERAPPHPSLPKDSLG